MTSSGAEPIVLEPDLRLKHYRPLHDVAEDVVLHVLVEEVRALEQEGERVPAKRTPTLAPSRVWAGVGPQYGGSRTSAQKASLT